VDHAEADPLLGRITRLFQQFALRRGERSFAGVDLSGRDLDELAPVRVAELPFKEQAAFLEQRKRSAR